MPFSTEPEPDYGAILPLLPGISRIVANNPSPMTYFGTNTYLIDGPGGTVVLDPGPDDRPEHVEAIMRHTGGQIALILVSHTHYDHVGAVPALRAACGAPTAGFKNSAIEAFEPDIQLGHGATVAGMTALHTPGHASDHLCFARATGSEKILFTADHVMSWSTSIVSPPGGNMRHYFESMKLLLQRDDDAYLPGHGPLLRQPRQLVHEMLAHRMLRESAIVETLKLGARATDSITDALYSQVNPRLRRAAERNVLAHLLKLEEEGKVARDADVWRVA